MSGYPDNVVTELGILEAGAVFVQKSIQPFDLLRKVRELLDSRKKPPGN